MKYIDEREKEFDELLKPKVFCGEDHCSGFWNYPCDDNRHPDGRKLINFEKAKSFHRQSILDTIEKCKEIIPLSRAGELEDDETQEFRKGRNEGLREAREALNSLTK